MWPTYLINAGGPRGEGSSGARMVQGARLVQKARMVQGMSGGEDGAGDKVCLGDKGGGPRGEVGGDVIYKGSSILGINVNKGIICLLSFCRE